MSLDMRIEKTGPSSDTHRVRTHKWRENNKERYAATNNVARNNAHAIQGFIGVDGEGMRTRCEKTGCDCNLFTSREDGKTRCADCTHAEDNHYHAYVLLGIGNEYISTGTLGIPEIGWEESFEFLYQEFMRPANRYKVFCGFSLGYDFTEIFKTLPGGIAWKLYNSRGNIRESIEGDTRPVSNRKPVISSREMTKGKGKPWPVRITGKRGAWEFDTLDERQLRLRPFNCGCANLAYHTQNCNQEGCTGDHHLTGQLCNWKNGAVTAPEWMYVNDVFSYFQKSFLKVIDPVDWAQKDCPSCQAQSCIKHGTVKCPECKPPACPEHGIVTREEYQTIYQGKERRETAILDREMIEYNKLENNLLARVMATFREGLTHFGIHLDIDQWYGPGQAAGKWIDLQGQNASCAVKTATKNGKPYVKREDNPLFHSEATDRTGRLVEKAARASYIAGWFEIFAHGHIPGTTYEYDINSAYPAIIKDLPCMKHGKWEQGYSGGVKLKPLPKGAAFRLIHATVTGSDPHIGAMLHRDFDYNICRPHKTHSWYWQDELEAAQAAGLIDTIEIGCNQDMCHEDYRYGGALTLTYFPKPSCGKLCAGMEHLYQERLRVGKNTPMGKAAKLVYNSVYGKFAQLVGSPVWASNIYASRITSGCRKMILGAIATHPEGSRAVVMVATDGIYFTSEHPTLPVDKEALGLWSVEQKENLTLFKPGVYWDDESRDKISKGEAPQFKSRGVSARKFKTEIGKIDAMFNTWNGKFPDNKESWPSVEFASGFSQTSCKQALMRGKWETAGKVSTTGKQTQNSYPDGKRAYTDVIINGEIVKAASRIIGEYDPEYKLYRSNPVIKSCIVSIPRKENQTAANMRDEGDNLDCNTPDGTVSDLLAGVLGIRD